jgi:hypothetical protein
MCDQICLEGTIHLVEHEDADGPMQQVIIRGSDARYNDKVTVSSNYRGQFRTFLMKVTEGQVAYFILDHKEPFDLREEYGDDI